MTRIKHPSPPSRKSRLLLEALEGRDCPSTYSIVDLLPPTGSNSSTGLGLNDQGVVVGDSTVSNYGRPTVWQVGAGPTAAGTFLTLFGADTGGNANDVNNSGMIAGMSRVVGVEGPNRAVVWTGGGSYVPHDLGNLAGFDSSQAISLSEPDPGNVTWVVGISESVGAPEQPEHATVWRVNAAGAVLSTIDLEPTLNVARAKDVRVIDPSPVAGDEYVLVTGEVQLLGVQPAVVWKLDLAGNVLPRTDLGTLGGSASTGYGINNLGHVVGWSKPTTGSQRGFIHKDGAMINLGTITNGFSTAYALNDNDVVVGNCAIFSKSGVYQGNKAFVWENGTMLDLRAQLGSAAKANWSTLFSGFDVNAAGQIVGRGSVGKGNAAEGHAFLMTPPALHAKAPGTNDGAALLSADQVQPLLAEATMRWQAAGVDTSGLSNLDVRITDLGGTTLGLASGNTIWLDDNAAGWGWFVDATPWDDSEFTTPGNQGEQNRMDLLTVLMHEIGHVLGHEHDEGGVMAETLTAGTRLRPLVDAADWLAAVDVAFSKKSSSQWKWW